MKKLFSLLVIISSFYLTARAQSPDAFNYQAVARDNAGIPLANKTIAVRTSILDGDASGAVVYSESHIVATNESGLFSLQIGKGTPEESTFSSVQWGSGSKYLKVELDVNGGSNFEHIGTTQLLSVPYALYAKNIGPAVNLYKSKINGRDIEGKGRFEIFPDSTETINVNTQTIDRFGDSEQDLILQLGFEKTDTKRWAMYESWNGAGLYLGTGSTFNEPRPIVFAIDRTEKARLDPNGNLGIGLSNPSQKLSVNGTIESVSGGFKFPDGTVQTTAAGFKPRASYNLFRSKIRGTEIEGEGRFEIFPDSTQTTNVNTEIIQRFGNEKNDLIFQLGFEKTDYDRWAMYESWNGAGLYLGTGSTFNEPRPIVFAIDRTEKIRIDSEGNLGIGTSAPKAKVEVAYGDVYINDASHGIILKSPNGGCWRVTIDDAGNFQKNAVTCP